MNDHILVVDDEPDIRQTLREILEDEGFRVTLAGNGAQAREAYRENLPDLVLLDIWMPDVDGITLLREWRDGAAPVVIMSGHGTVDTAVEATRLGAFDYLEKPLSIARLLATLERALGPSRGRTAPSATVAPAHIVSRSAAMGQVLERLTRLAAQPYGITLWGPPGAGKRLLAQHLHALSPRAQAPCLILDGDSEGQRLDALLADESAWEGIATGTLVLLHLGALDRERQRVLTARLVRGPAPRLVATTLEAPGHLVQSGRLLPALFARVAEVELRVPGLEDRREDIPDLARHLVEELVSREGLPYRPLSIAALNRLRHAPWPAGLTGLRALLRRLLAEGGGEVGVTEVAACLEMEAPAETTLDDLLELPLREARERFERRYLSRQLERAGGNMSELARLTGMERTHLYRKLRSLGIEARRIKKT